MLSVTVRAHNGERVLFVRTALLPPGNHFRSRDIVHYVAGDAQGFNILCRDHDVGRGRVVFIIAMGKGIAMTLHATDAPFGMAAGQDLFQIVNRAPTVTKWK
jgi:hypothetical protein